MGSKKKGSKGKTWKSQIRMEEPIDKSLTKDQLKAELKKRGLRTSGSKSELLQRLEKKIAPTSSGASVLSMPVARRKPEMTTQHSNGNTPPGRRSAVEAAQRDAERKERERLVIWRKPIQTVYYSALETVHFLRASLDKMLQHRVLVTIAFLLVSASVLLVTVRGPHQKVVQPLVGKAWWCIYWVGLGVLSSVGLGTGLHTFLLYLGPHIASVTLAAYECQSLDFPSPPYPDEIVCPDTVGSSAALWQGGSSVWTAVFAIMAKVRLEAFMWGAGTALGELPPYFMARAARLSGLEPDEEEDELRDFEELQRKKANQEQMTLYERAKLKIEQLVERVGFFGILACASIPNPLFDLAGITCGHFLVPFWTFFGATLIGKAVVKMHIQKLFVIIAFNEPLLEAAVLMLGRISYIGPRLQEPFKEFLVRQKTKLHRKTGSRTPGDAPAEASLLASLFEKFVLAMVLYFVVSIVNSLAQAYHKRLHKRARGEPKLARD